MFLALIGNLGHSEQKKEGLENTVVPEKKNWADRISFRGYTQIRYNRLFETNPDLRCEQCDKSWGGGNSLFIRRARLIFSGDVYERLYIYIQPDLASAINGGLNYLQMRDLYFDFALDSKKESRLRFGQSKIPYGFENMQSSANRLTLDRSDGLNSGVPNERDLGVMYYWAPLEIRKRFRELIVQGLKGSGDYGVVGLGTYVGQTLNRPELNNNLHLVARVSYPFKLSNGQFFEPGIQAYSGQYTIPTGDSSVRGPTVKGDTLFTDQRVAASFIYYPQPFGFQVEGNVGRGPEYNSSTNSIDTQPLRGGYVQLMVALKPGDQTLIPFIRTHYYKGGKKQELDARSYTVREYNVGAEWQINPVFELTGEYVISSRTTSDSKTALNSQSGNLFRLQAQFNY